MTDHRSGRGGFEDFDGELELDLPDGKMPEAPEYVESERTLAPVPVAPPVAPPAAPRPTYERASRSELSQAKAPSKIVGRLLVLAVLGVIGFGVYYGWCFYKASSRQTGFDGRVIDLRQGLLHLGKRVVRVDVENVLKRYARESKITFERLLVTTEPLDEQSMQKLNKITRTALSIAGKMRGHRAPACVIGFRVSCATTVGMVTKKWVSQRYTWFDYMAKKGCIATDAVDPP